MGVDVRERVGIMCTGEAVHRFPSPVEASPVHTYFPPHHHHHLSCRGPTQKFLEFLRREVEKIRVGHPLEAGVRMGPLVNKVQVCEDV